MKWYILFFIILISGTNIYASFVADCSLEVKVLRLIGKPVHVKNSDQKFISQKTEFQVLKVISEGDIDSGCNDHIKKKFVYEIKTSDPAKIKVGKNIKLFYRYTSSEIVKKGMVVGMSDFHEWTTLEDVRE